VDPRRHCYEPISNVGQGDPDEQPEAVTLPCGLVAATYCRTHGYPICSLHRWSRHARCRIEVLT
jgi:hypothetical protein